MALKVTLKLLGSLSMQETVALNHQPTDQVATFHRTLLLMVAISHSKQMVMMTPKE